MIGSMLPQYAAWVGGTAVGVLGEGLVGDLERLGLDAVFPAFFLILLKNELKSARTAAVALTAAVVALALVPFAPPGVPVIAACAASLLGLRQSS